MKKFRKGQKVYVPIAHREGTIVQIEKDFVRVKFPPIPGYTHPFDIANVQPYMNCEN